MKTPQWEHQRREFEDHWATPARALLWGMRTGKSKSAIDKACQLYQICAIDGVIVIAPNGIHRNWTLRQIPLHHWPDVPYRAYAWRTPEKDNEALARVLADVPFSGLDWFTVNMEILHDDRIKKAIGRFTRAHKNYMLIVDESHHEAKPGSKRTKAVRTIAKHACYRLIMTGTSVEETPLQSYAQFQILEPGALGFKDFAQFKDHFAEFHTQHTNTCNYPALTRYKNLGELKRRIAKYSSVVLRSDCEDLPPIQIDARIVELTDKQREYFHMLKSQAVRELMDHGFKSIPEGGALLTKLHQIEGGFFNTPLGLKFIDDSAKFNVALEEAIGYTSLVWCAYRHEIEHVAKRFNKAGIKSALIMGGSPDREGILSAFQAGRIQAVIAQPAAIGEGYELSAAEKIIWYSQIPRAAVRSQANERASKIGTKGKQVIDIYAPGGTDEYYLELTNTKTELAEDISRSGLRAILDRLNV